MIIDAHGHVSAPAELYAYNYKLIATRGDFGKGNAGISDDRLAAAVAPHVAMLDAVGTDLQLIPPRPWGLPQNQSEKIVRWMAEAANDLVARQVGMYPTRFAGLAGLPIVAGAPLTGAIEELERGMIALGMIGAMVNPDPGEGDGATPGMGEEYWYPLYERAVALDAPLFVHTGNNGNARETQSEHFITEESIAALSLLRSPVFRDFPTLRIVIAHGGGSVPYQVGRYRSSRAYLRFADREGESFDDRLRKLWFDTVLYNQESIELLLKIAGVDRCLFGTDTPGTGSVINPATGRPSDDLRPVVEAISWLTADDRTALFEGNARRVFPRIPQEPK
jgi:predicted TIM-barrel fold metal-dependent hydrolase